MIRSIPIIQPARAVAAWWLLCASWVLLSNGIVSAQSVCLPLPRLLSIMPMGGAAGTTVEATITGENLEDAGELLFDHPGIQATTKRDANGKLEPNKYLIAIAPDCPVGLFESRVTSRLGISSARIFSVGNLSESIPSTPNTTLATAASLAVNSVCNAVVSGIQVCKRHHPLDIIRERLHVVV